MHEQHLLDIFRKHKAFLEGHFELSSGLHSSKYLQCALALQHPKLSEELGIALAEKYKDRKIDVVIGPALGGITIAYEVARAVNARNIFSERKDGQMQLRRGFEISPREKVLIVEDVITTGGSTAEVVGIAEAHKADIIGVATIVDRSGKDLIFAGQRVKSLIKLNVPTYNLEECPLCKEGIPLTKPGSKK